MRLWEWKYLHFFMIKLNIYLKFSVVLSFLLFFGACESADLNDDLFLFYEVNPQKQDLRFYWKNENNERFANFGNLKTAVEKQGRHLVFAMNGGMFSPSFSPQGLYIGDKKELTKLDTSHGKGNFYMQPNGVFYIDDKNKPFICETSAFWQAKNVKYATQSGPMLISTGKMHKGFAKKSENTNLRNGVGLLPNGNLLFVMSKEKVNFYQFAHYFERKGCQNALYLDGFVSKTYLPEKQANALDGDFGVIIAVSK